MQIVVDNDGYFYYKFINTLIFTNDYDEVFDSFLARYGQPRLLSLVMLNAIVLNLGSIIDDDMRRNILNFTDYLRDVFNDNNELFVETEVTKEDCFNFCNEIINYVNGHSIKGDELSYYCAEQLLLRGYGVIDRVKLTGKTRLLSTFKWAKKLQVQDFAVLADFYEDKTGQLFELKKDEYSNPNYLYITSIIVLIQENPNLLNDENFLLRTKIILDKYKNNINECKLDKETKKKMLVKNYRALESELMKSTIK